ILRGVRQQQDEPGRFSICSRQAAVVQSAGGTLERATAAFEPVVQRHEMAVAAERAHEQRQHEKELTEARSRQRSYDGPSLG
ncbi:hypothetical protein LVW09_30000, partial [Klebsiella pneumoniae]|nr:hypothetical protein [Klebsiella pneumoniae]